MVIDNALIVYGAYQMLGLRQYRWAKLAAILGMLPVTTPFCLLGIPFGLRAFMRLNEPQVQQAFDK